VPYRCIRNALGEPGTLSLLVPILAFVCSSLTKVCEALGSYMCCLLFDACVHLFETVCGWTSYTLVLVAESVRLLLCLLCPLQ